MTFLTALAILFVLTTLALAASGQLHHPIRAGISLAATLVVEIALLAD